MTPETLVVELVKESPSFREVVKSCIKDIDGEVTFAPSEWQPNTFFLTVPPRVKDIGITSRKRTKMV